MTNKIRYEKQMSDLADGNRENSVQNAKSKSSEIVSESESYLEIFKESFPDARELTDNQRKRLLMMLHDVLVELRIYGFQGKSEQAHDLADAFHNLPAWLTLEVFSFDHFRMYLNAYHRSHSKFIYNYLDMLDKIEKDEK